MHDSGVGTRVFRVAAIYPTKWQYSGGEQPPLRNHPLEGFYAYFQDQRLGPSTVLNWARLPTHSVRFAEPGAKSSITGLALSVVDFWLFKLPSDQVVMAIVIDIEDPGAATRIDAIADVLDCTVEGAACAVRINGRDLGEYVDSVINSLEREFGTPAVDKKWWQRPLWWIKKVPAVAAFEAYKTSVGKKALPVEEEPTPTLLAEHHQIVFLPAGVDRPDDHEVKRIIYRERAPYTEEFCKRAKDPQELNPGEENGVDPRAVISTYVTLLYGQDTVVEDSVLLSTVQAVGTASRFRQIWEESYHWVRVFRREQQKAEVGTQRRKDLESLVDRLGNLEFDLTFSVEFPLIRVAGTDPVLSTLLDLGKQAETLSQMFIQLGGSVRSEIIAIDIRERQADELKRRQGNFAANLLTILGVTIGAMLAFLGINAKEVDKEWSLFDLTHYGRYYLIALMLGLVPFFVFQLARVIARMGRRPLPPPQHDDLGEIFGAPSGRRRVFRSTTS